MNKTKIDWCDSTWNPVTGCLHGCGYCYARGIARRFGRVNDEDGSCHYVGIRHRAGANFDGKAIHYPFGFDPTFHGYRLDDYKGKTGRTIFVCSMADLFGDFIPEDWIMQVFSACKAADQHRYLFLTKNPKRYAALNAKKKLPLSDNMWYGTTVTSQKDYEKRGMDLFAISPFTDNIFFSVEPILELVGFGLYPEWIIIGAQSGNAKDIVAPKKEWVDNLVNAKIDVPVFMKESLRGIMGDDFIQEFPWKDN